MRVAPRQAVTTTSDLGGRELLAPFVPREMERLMHMRTVPGASYFPPRPSPC